MYPQKDGDLYPQQGGDQYPQQDGDLYPQQGGDLYPEQGGVAFELISLVIFPIKFLNEMSSSIEGHWSFGWAYIVGWAGAVSEFAVGLFLLLDKGADELILRQKHVADDIKPNAEEAERTATEDAV
ncbi:hypothetical protein Btru_063644 [Bulinus truncatus]|nr:hypothetical protein Btru_063644 [Bulinus truncatus]